MFYAADAMLRGESIESASKHTFLIANFGKVFAKTNKVDPEYHRYLIDAEADRKESDYNLESRLTDEDALKHIAHAEAFLKLAETHFTPGTDSQTS